MNEMPGNWLPLETVQQGSSFKRRIVLSPSIHIEETRTSAGSEIAGAELRPKEGQSAQWQRLGRQRYAHHSLHVCPHTKTPPPFVIPTRDDPPDQSHFFDTQQQDWRFWEKHRDLVFQGKGIHPADPIWDRVHALAEDIWTFRYTIQKPGGNNFSREMPWSHPTTALIYGSWCAGCAPALCALCATIGVPTRMVQIVDHMMVEAWLQDRWCLIDNVTDFAQAGGNMMLRGSLADVLLDPTREEWEFIDKQKGKYWEKTIMQYTPSTGLFNEEPWTTFLTPQNALAVYPSWIEPRFKSHREKSYDLVWGQPSHSSPVLVLKQGQAFRRRFWIGSLAETKSMRATFCGEGGCTSGIAQYNVPQDGGDWFIDVNGSRFSVGELGGWDFHHSPGPNRERLKDVLWTHGFEVPIQLLREHSWNHVAIGATGSGSEFLRFGGTSDWILPEETCWCPQTSNE